MYSFLKRTLHLFEAIHPLDRIPRAGYLLRGVTEAESVSAHSHFVSLMTLLFAEEYPRQFDSPKAVAMALIHDLSESTLMDIPMPAADAHLREAKKQAEQAITETLFAGFSDKYEAYHQEFLDAETPEARLVRGLDKAQMMVKIVMYEREGRGRFEEFWLNPKNFADYGIAPVSDFFDAICAEAGHVRPH